MAANWYPTIDYEKCTNCLQCVEFCPHGVLQEKDGVPRVMHPEKCPEFCRGCQKVCDFGAISFPGDKEV